MYDDGWKIVGYDVEQATVQLSERVGDAWQTSNVVYGNGAEADSGSAGAGLSAIVRPASASGLTISHGTASTSQLSVFDRTPIRQADRVFAEPLDGRSVRLVWLDRTDDNTGYSVEVSADEGRTWRRAAAADADSTAAVVEDLEPHTGYAFRVNSMQGDVSAAATAPTFAATGQDESGWYRVTGLGDDVKTQVRDVEV